MLELLIVAAILCIGLVAFYQFLEEGLKTWDEFQNIRFTGRMYERLEKENMQCVVKPLHVGKHQSMVEIYPMDWGLESSYTHPPDLVYQRHDHKWICIGSGEFISHGNGMDDQQNLLDLLREHKVWTIQRM